MLMNEDILKALHFSSIMNKVAATECVFEIIKHIVDGLSEME